MKLPGIKDSNAVSPVVGIMLMLVITIIIAAVVSAFAGNMITADSSAPKATITGTYSQSTGLTMNHKGGDSLFIADIEILVRPSDEFGHGQSDFGSRKLNFSTVTNGKRVEGEYVYWIEKFGTYGVTSWIPGETMYVINDGSTTGDLAMSGLVGKTEVTPYYSGYGNLDNSTRFSVTGFNNQFNIGKTITLEVYDKSGKMISSYDMVIQP
mgnify:CR=1 FL=1|jgi:FlaG/FlaF family flagellin (archaellin)